jgi:hypothetical protein
MVGRFDDVMESMPAGSSVRQRGRLAGNRKEVGALKSSTRSNPERMTQETTSNPASSLRSMAADITEGAKIVKFVLCELFLRTVKL